MSLQSMCVAIMALVVCLALARPQLFEEKPAPPAQATVKVVVREPAIKPDGYMTEEDCATVASGMQVSDLVFKYGWPAGDYSLSSFDQKLFYPIHDHADDKCVVGFDDNKVVTTLYRDE